jgi:hypothetical protein
MDFKKTIAELVKEFLRTDYVFQNNPNEYFNEFKGNGGFFTTINAPDDLFHEMHKKRKENAPCYYQLHHSELSLWLIRKLAESVKKTSQLQCKPSELIPVLEASLYEYINYHFENYLQSSKNDDETDEVEYNKVLEILTRRIAVLKKEMSQHTFRFPVTIFGFEHQIQLSKNISLIPIASHDKVEEELTQLKKTRLYDINFWLEIQIKGKCTEALALQLAEKARESTFNILRLLATRLSPNAIPLLSSSDLRRHQYDFHMHGKFNNDLGKNTTRHFPTIHADSEEFWKRFHEARKDKNNIIDISLEISESLLSLTPSKPRVVEIIERALVWYGDAVVEQNSQQQIQKLVISLEAIVNFNDDDTTETFCRRVTNLNILHSGFNDEARKKAEELYKVRSNIIHGSSINERLTYCAIEFCSETLIRAIYYLYLFGFTEVEFKTKVANLLDNACD